MEWNGVEWNENDTRCLHSICALCANSHSVKNVSHTHSCIEIQLSHKANRVASRRRPWHSVLRFAVASFTLAACILSTWMLDQAIINS